MATKSEHYDTKELMRTGKVTEAASGWRAMSTSFTNNNEREGYDVVFDNSADVPAPKRQMTRLAFVNRLAEDRNIELI